MGRFLITLGWWLILIGLGLLIGDRYGAPQWASDAATRGFEAVEERVEFIAPAIAEDDADDAEDADADADADEPGAESEEEADASSNAAAGIEANATLKINEAGLQIIKDSEGLRLDAYSAGGKSYIGYGHQLQPGDPSTITEAQAEQLLRQDVAATEDGVRARLFVPANENEFSAMVSLAYNLGIGGFSNSPVLAKFNDGDTQGAADAFLTHNKAGGNVIEHLTHRREKERTLFLTLA